MNRERSRTNLSAKWMFFKRRQIVREIRLEATMVAFVKGRSHVSEICRFLVCRPPVNRSPCLQYNKNQAGRRRKQKFWDLGFKFVLH
jgi:hypothetical protein